jgi:hypothetical protein
MRNFILLLTIGLLTFPTWAQAPLSEASPLQLAACEFMGDYAGTWKTGESDEQPAAAQVIALEGGKYSITLYPRLYDGREALASLKGERKGDTVAVRGSGAGDAAGTRWKGVIENGTLHGAVDESGAFALSRVTRTSPSMGAEPPEGAVVLFDGTNTDAFIHPGADPNVFDLKTVSDADHAVAYLRTQVWSPEAREVQFEAGSDDSIKVWVNGKEVHANNASRGVTVGEDKFPVKLAPEWNDVLLKVVQGTGGWGFALQITGNYEDLRVKPVFKRAAFVPLLDSEGFVMDWQVSAPHQQEGVTAEDLFDVAFAPENGEGGEWQPMPLPASEGAPCRWLLLEDGIMQVNAGGIVSKEKFNDHRVHLEWRTPFMPEKSGQDRGNSGVYLQGRYEVQILDSYGLEGKDNEAGGIYTVAPPRINMCYPPLQWQTYDIEFRAPRYDAEGNKTTHAKLTVWHNGVLIQDQVEAPYFTRAHVGGVMSEPGPLHLQDHGNPVWYRNIWVERIEE